MLKLGRIGFIVWQARAILPAVALVSIGLLLPVGWFLSKAIDNRPLAADMPATAATLQADAFPDRLAQALVSDLMKAHADQRLARIARRFGETYSGGRELFLGIRSWEQSQPIATMNGLRSLDQRWANPDLLHGLRAAFQHLTLRHAARVFDVASTPKGWVPVPDAERIYLRVYPTRKEST